MRELAQPARGGQDAGSHNLSLDFFDISVVHRQGAAKSITCKIKGYQTKLMEFEFETRWKVSSKTS